MDKKTIILSVVGLLILGGLFAFAYYNSDQDVSDQPASVSQGTGNQQQNGDSESQDPGQQSEVTGEDIILGSPNAPVTMIDYSKYSCGHCANFHAETLPQLMQDYVETGKLKIVVRRLSPVSLSAAAICSGEQDKFSKADSYLFENALALFQQAQQTQQGQGTSEEKQEQVNQLISTFLGNMANTLELNQEAFADCVNNQEQAQKVQNWFTQAQTDKVTGTPTFFINGEKLSGNQPEKIKDLIDKNLE